MSDSNVCKILNLIKEQIENGTPPDQAIPYSIECADMDAYMEVLYYAAQVLPDGRRREEIRTLIKELNNVRRTDSEL